MPKPWAGYIRVSHVGRRGGDSFHSPEDQARDIRRWADEKGVTVELLPPDLDGKSNDWNRPILNRALDGLAAGRYAGIVVAKQDRLARDVPLLYDLVSRVDKAGGQLAYATEHVDTTTPDGRMWFTMRAAMDQRVREQHGVDFERQRKAATERGIWQRRQTPTGYDRDPVTRRLIPNGDAPRVVQAFADRAAGRPLVQIADSLGMTPSGARYLLRNRVYLGELRVGKHLNPLAHPALVDEDVFAQTSRLRVTRPARTGSEVALLAGLARCCGCGHLMSRARTKSLVYGCHVRHSAGRCEDPAAITVASLDRHVEAVAIGEFRRLAASPVDDGQALKAARIALGSAQDELERFLAGVEAAGIAAEDFAAAARARRQRVDTARRDLADLGVSLSVGFDGDPDAMWASFTVSERNHVLRGLLEAVIVKSAGRGRVVPPASRVRVIAAGSDLGLPVPNADGVIPLRPLVLPDIDTPGVLGVLDGEDAL